MSHLLHLLGLDQLSRADRLVLVQELWDSIAAEPLPTLLTETQRVELERRLHDSEADPDALICWEQVFARTAKRLQS